MNKLFGYARVSTAPADRLDQNLDTRLDALQRAGCDEIFQDKITGMSTSRPALDELQAKLRPGDTVMVARFFRLGRSRDHLITLLSGFARQGIHFKALDLGVDSSTPAGKLVLQIFAALAEYDRESLLEKTRAGQLLEPEGEGGLSFMELAHKLDVTKDRREIVATGKAGTVYLCHPFIAHAAQDHQGTVPKFMAQPPLLTAQDFSLHRVDGNFCPVEAAIPRGLAPN